MLTFNFSIWVWSINCHSQETQEVYSYPDNSVLHCHVPIPDTASGVSTLQLTRLLQSKMLFGCQGCRCRPANWGGDSNTANLIKQRTTTRDSSSKGSNTLFWPSFVHTHVAYTDTNIHINKILKHLWYNQMKTMKSCMARHYKQEASLAGVKEKVHEVVWRKRCPFQWKRPVLQVCLRVSTLKRWWAGRLLSMMHRLYELFKGGLKCELKVTTLTSCLIMGRLTLSRLLESLRVHTGWDDVSAGKCVCLQPWQPELSS